jgi:hypothetical protein
MASSTAIDPNCHVATAAHKQLPKIKIRVRVRVTVEVEIRVRVRGRV